MRDTMLSGLVAEEIGLNTEDRIDCYRGWVARLACAIYNGEGWDKQALASYLHMGDQGLDYTFPGNPPEELTEDAVLEAIDAMFARFETKP